jgi:hypothetical protein
VAFLVTLCLPLIGAVIAILALQNPTPESALGDGAREVFRPPTADPVAVVRRSDSELSDASFGPPDSHRAREGPQSLE